MSDEKSALLKIGADGTQAKEEFKSVAAAGKKMGEDIAASADKSGNSISGIAAKAKPATDGLDRATRSMVQSIERTTAAFTAGSKSSSDYYRVLAEQRGIDPKILQPYLDALDKVAPKQQEAIDALAKTVPVLEKTGMSAKATAAALRQVPAQFTDIIVSLQGGQAPLTVLLQQGGQLKDIFGGIVPAARALGGFIASLISPLTVAVAAVGTLGVAFFQGRKEVEEFNRAIILSGNYAGTSAGALAKMADAISDSSGATKGAAAEALNAFVSSASISSANLERFASVAIKVQKETGVAVAETVKNFTALGKDPVDATIKLNESMRYLTLEVYNQIKALDDQGRKSEAAALAQKAFADAQDAVAKKLNDNLGFLERSARTVTGAFKDLWDAVLNVGREESVDQQIVNLEKQIANAAALATAARNRGQNVEGTGVPPQMQAELDNLRETARLKARAAESVAQESRDVERRINFDKARDQFLTKEVRLRKELAAAENEFGLLVARNIITQKEYDQLLAGIREKYTDRGAVSKAAELEKAQAALDVLAIQKATEAKANAYANAEKQLEALRAAGLVTDAKYYADKQDLLTKNAELQASALTDEIAREKARKVIGFTETEKELVRVDIAKNVLELESKRKKVMEDAATASVVLSVQETTAAKKVADAYLEAAISAENYLAVLERANARRVAAVGQGDVARTKDAERAAIEERARAQTEEAGSAFRRSGRTEQDLDVYLKRLQQIRDLQQAEIKSWEETFAKIKAAEADWTNGANRAIENYVDQSRNAAQMSADFFTRAFRSMEDALVDFAMSGQLNFKKLADGIISDLIRIEVRRNILGPILDNSKGSIIGGGIGDFLGNVFGTRASGGPVEAGRPYLVGEKGPELIMPTANGTVIPNSALTGGGSVTVIQNINIDSRSDQATIMSAMMQAKEMAKNEIMQSRQRGGAFA